MQSYAEWLSKQRRALTSRMRETINAGENPGKTMSSVTRDTTDSLVMRL